MKKPRGAWLKSRDSDSQAFRACSRRAGLDSLLTQDEIRQLPKTCQQPGTHDSDHLIETVTQTYGR